jgi:hypothetical protein
MAKYHWHGGLAPCAKTSETEETTGRNQLRRREANQLSFRPCSLEAVRARTARASLPLVSIRPRPRTTQETTKPSFRMRDILPSSSRNYPDKLGTLRSGPLHRSRAMRILRLLMPLFSRLEIAKAFRSCFQNLRVTRGALASFTYSHSAFHKSPAPAQSYPPLPPSCRASTARSAGSAARSRCRGAPTASCC